MTIRAKHIHYTGPLTRIAQATIRLIPTRQEFKALCDCFKPPRNCRSCLCVWWRTLSLDCRRFLSNLMIGFFVVGLLAIFHNAPVLKQSEDAAMDWGIQMRKGEIPIRSRIPLGWIDIDDKTYLKISEPLYLPRDKLAKLIDFALRSKPRIVVMDVEFAQRNLKTEVDQPIIDELSEYAEKCKDKPLLSSEECPPVLLLASLRSSFEHYMPEQRCSKPDAIAIAVPPKFQYLSIQRCSRLDKLVADSPHLFWASPLFEKDIDQLIRRWRMLEVVVRESDGRMAVLPSIQLLVSALLDEKEVAWNKMKMGFSDNTLEKCAYPDGRTSKKDSLDHQEALVRCSIYLWKSYYSTAEAEEEYLSSGRVEQRIHYTIPWQADAPNDSASTIPMVTIKGKERLLLSRIPAYSVLSNTKVKPEEADLRGRVVFIGGSFGDSRDIHATPLGQMPGVLILINALHSLLEHEVSHEIGPLYKLVIEIVLITMLSIAYSLLDSFWSQVVTFLAVYVIWGGLSIYLFNFGLWLDFAIPLAAIQFYDLSLDLKESLMARHHKT